MATVKVNKTFKTEDLGRLGQEGYLIIKDKKGIFAKKYEYNQVQVSKHIGDDIVKVIKEKADGTSIVQYARDNRVEVVDTTIIKTHEKPLIDF